MWQKMVLYCAHITEVLQKRKKNCRVKPREPCLLDWGKGGILGTGLQSSLKHPCFHQCCHPPPGQHTHTHKHSIHIATHTSNTYILTHTQTHTHTTYTHPSPHHTYKHSPHTPHIHTHRYTQTHTYSSAHTHTYTGTHIHTHTTVRGVWLKCHYFCIVLKTGWNRPRNAKKCNWDIIG